jgi:hypothetical protein
MEPKRHRGATHAAPANDDNQAAGAPPPRLRIRLYRHGLGDCFLLRFARGDQGDTFNVLIDCGIITVAKNAKQKMIEVANDIKETCGGRLDVVVMTHEHWDHASGFSTQQAREVFDDIKIGEVWYGWTEDPQNALGVKLRQERAAKVQAVARASQALAALGETAATGRSTQLDSILGFFGADTKTDKVPIAKTRDAFEYLLHRPDVKTRYCYPGKAPSPFKGVENVRAYVLGPPMDEGMIKKSTPTRGAEQVYELAAEANLTGSLDTAFLRMGRTAPESGDDCPFHSVLQPGAAGDPALADLQRDVWDAADQDWRKIETDWTHMAETLALNLDSHTNNTCVVLAFEFTDTGEVFLFPADAQVGNWLSWQALKWQHKDETGVSQVTTDELLNRTVFYKVGHHGSHNATLRALGLERMTSEELIAFIPVIKGEAEQNHWMQMPFLPLVARLNEKTAGRLLRSDTNPSAKLQEMASLQIDKLYFELSFG